MIQAHLDKDKAVPLWAVIGAPLIGVPLMVALLTLAAPAESTAVLEVEAGVAVEQMDVQPVDHTIEVDDDAVQEPLRRG